jgi:predicted nucleic acid-binding Zn finger protein
MEITSINNKSNQLLLGIENLIEQKGRNVAVYLNAEVSRLYWSIGNYIVTEMQYETYSQHGQQILATVSQTLSWSHFIELVSIEDSTKRMFYQQMCIAEKWSIHTIATCFYSLFSSNSGYH